MARAPCVAGFRRCTPNGMRDCAGGVRAVELRVLFCLSLHHIMSPFEGIIRRTQCGRARAKCFARACTILYLRTRVRRTQCGRVKISVLPDLALYYVPARGRARVNTVKLGFMVCLTLHCLISPYERTPDSAKSIRVGVLLDLALYDAPVRVYAGLSVVELRPGCCLTQVALNYIPMRERAGVSTVEVGLFFCLTLRYNMSPPRGYAGVSAGDFARCHVTIDWCYRRGVTFGF